MGYKALYFEPYILFDRYILLSYNVYLIFYGKEKHETFLAAENRRLLW